jgi:ATP-dependent DNA helicase DinG
MALADPAADAQAEAADVLHRTTELLAAGEDRPQQQAMASAVARALHAGRHLAVQAGTGTGKSLAYLVPALASGNKVVVATATKALQDQLATKDLPLVSRAMDRPVAFAVLKGRSNYLCMERAREAGSQGIQATLEEGVAETETRGRRHKDGAATIADQLRRLLAWSNRTESGDRADLDFEPHPRAWAMVSVGPRECPGAFRCPSGEVCFAERARDEAARADVVVVNTHLYGAHLASGRAVLPEHDAVVFDEAHEVEEIMTACLGVEVAPGRFRALAAQARPVLAKDTSAGLLEDMNGLTTALEAALGERVGERVLEGPDGPARRDAVLAGLLTRAEAKVRDLLDRLPRPTRGAGVPGEDGREARVLAAVGHLAEDLRRLAGRTPDEVAWVDGTSRAPVLTLSPVDVGPALAELLWDDVTAVFTSATVPLRLPERLGIPRSRIDELDVGSPFDFKGHSILYVARHLPDRRDPASEPSRHQELSSLIEAAGGRTLALFTSRRATEAAADDLKDHLPGRLLVQGEAPKGRLLSEFTEDETSSLFATIGFWQGVDVPGRACILVTLDRLPFGRPDDPLLQARRDRAGPEAFQLIDLPRAAILLAQGAGRLIRTAEDRGVVAVLDPRLATAGYRRVLLARMPPMRRSTDGQQVREFLRAVADGSEPVSSPSG